MNATPVFATQRSAAYDGRLETLRGGALSTEQPRHTKGKPASSVKLRKILSNIGVTPIIAALVVLTLVHHRETIQSCFDGGKFRAAIIRQLNNIASKGNVGLLIYTCGFVFWEACGLPTAVVEPAAGMAFGFQRGLWGSFVGKSAGSLLAFALGRTQLSHVVEEKMGQNEKFTLIERGVARHPLRSALVVRYSPFPELVKNFALSVTPPVTYPLFATAIAIHGLPFSILWAALGHDGNLRLRAAEEGETMPANRVLRGLLAFVTFFGFVVSPALTGWWLADVGREKKKTKVDGG